MKRGTMQGKGLWLGLLLLIASVAGVSPRTGIAQMQTAAVVLQAAGRTGTPEAQSPEKNQQEVDESEAYKHSDVVKFLGRKLGMSTEQAATVFEVFNFLVLAGALLYFLGKALPKTFRERTSQIQKRLVEARAATEEASARLNSVEARLSKLDEQIAGLRTQAEKDLAAEEQRVRASIEEERTKILAAADQEITAATAQARRQLQHFAAELAIDKAAKQITVSAETDRLLIREFTGRLNSGNGGQN